MFLLHQTGYNLALPRRMADVAGDIRNHLVIPKWQTMADGCCCRIFYWPGARFDASLLAQSLIMVVVQSILLKIALDHRPLPATKGGEGSVPFSGLKESSPFGFQRPYSFWQWRSHKP